MVASEVYEKVFKSYLLNDLCFILQIEPALHHLADESPNNFFEGHMSLYVDSNLPSNNGPYSSGMSRSAQPFGTGSTPQFSEITNQVPRPSKRAAAAAPPKDSNSSTLAAGVAPPVHTVPLPRSTQQQYASATAQPQSPTRSDSQFPVLSQPYTANQPPLHQHYSSSSSYAGAPPPPPPQPQQTVAAPSAEMVATFNALVGQMQTLMQQWTLCFPAQQLPAFDQPPVSAGTGNPADDMMANLIAQVGHLQGQLPPQHQQAPHHHRQQPQYRAPQQVAAVDLDDANPYRSVSAQQTHQQYENVYQPTTQQQDLVYTQTPPAHQQQHQQLLAPATFSRTHQFPPQGQQQREVRGPRISARGAVMENEPSECVLTLVEFKRARLKKFVALEFIQPGQYVIVEGDRGLDCGLVVLCCFKHHDGTVTNVSALQDYKTNEVLRFKTEIGRVQRVATKDDVDLLHGEIASIERQALQTCREVSARMNLPMEIIDCEYQFDKKKVSFYFEAPVSVDFRELNTELFRLFGVRIWLENVNAKVKNVVPEGALSYADKANFTKNGLRPPRRIQ